MSKKVNKKTRVAARTKLRGEKAAFTRRKAERAIARTTDVAELEKLAGHKNKHAVAKAKHKLARLEAIS